MLVQMNQAAQERAIEVIARGKIDCHNASFRSKGLRRKLLHGRALSASAATENYDDIARLNPTDQKIGS